MSAFITILTTEPKKEVRFTDKNQFDRMREARRHGDALMPVMNYCIRREDRFHALDCHWHSEMELFRVMQGTLTVQCGTDLFEAHAGDIVFFNSGELHAAVPVEAGEELYFEAIVFSPDLLCSTAKDIIRVKYIQPVLDGELTVPRLIRAGTNLHESVSAAFQTAYTMLENRPPFFEFPVKAAMLSAFGALVQNGVSARISASKRAAADSIKAAIAFIQENYRSAVSVQQLAHAAGMSEGHFCRVFKQYTLKTPVQFINGVRLSHALELLTATNLRVLDIAMDCGFNSMSYFIEVFRTEYDATPLQYRKKLEEIKVPK